MTTRHLTETKKDQVARLVHEYVDAYVEAGPARWSTDQLGGRFNEELLALGVEATRYANSLIEQMLAHDDRFALMPPGPTP